MQRLLNQIYSQFTFFTKWNLSCEFCEQQVFFCSVVCWIVLSFLLLTDWSIANWYLYTLSILYTFVWLHYYGHHNLSATSTECATAVGQSSVGPFSISCWRRTWNVPLSWSLGVLWHRQVFYFEKRNRWSHFHQKTKWGNEFLRALSWQNITGHRRKASRSWSGVYLQATLMSSLKNLSHTISRNSHKSSLYNLMQSNTTDLHIHCLCEGPDVHFLLNITQLLIPVKFFFFFFF